MFSFSMYPIRQDVNNRILSGVNAMPLKNDNADNESSLSNARRSYAKSINAENYTLPELHKKKYLGNRDASNVMETKKRNQIGYGSKNPTGEPLSFSSITNTNTIQNALTRVRAGGYVVPKKVTQKI